MKFSLIHRTDALILCVVLFIGMIIMLYLGELAARIWRKEEGEPKGGINALQTALFGLFGFILAFTFSMSGARYDSTRNIMVKEANDIGTAILRADLYADSVRRGFRADFRNYLAARIDLYANVRDTTRIIAAQDKMDAAAVNLWKRAMDQSKLPNMFVQTGNMVAALNSMFDTATSRDVMLRTSVPDTIIYMLFILAWVSCFLAGINTIIMKPKDIVIFICFAIFTSTIIYITLDLGRPMRGVIKVDISEQAIIQLEKKLQQP